MSSPCQGLKCLVFTALLCLITLSGSALAFSREGDFDPDRAKLLGFMVRQQLPRHHYSHKPFNDELSVAAFDLYLKQLDYQKRFLLAEDVERLKAFSNRIDEDLTLGKLELPSVSRKILEQRIPQVQDMVSEILDGDFDFTKDEVFETDPEKRRFCKNMEELKEYWRELLKFQVLSQYLILLEEDDTQSESGGEVSEKEEDKPAELLEDARKKVLKRHENLFSRMLGDTEQEYFDRYLNAVARAFDPHTIYLPPTQKEDFEISMSGSLEGIGATLREDDGYIKVVQIIPGSAAARQGELQEEDIILEVAEKRGEFVDITNTRIRDAVSLIRGKKGTEVRLKLKKPDGKIKTISIVRDVVQIQETFVKSTILSDDVSSETFGYVKIPSFYRDFKKTGTGAPGRNVTDDLRSEIKKLKAQGIKGLILDLRNNGGGSLTDAVSITGLFIETGPIVQIKRSDGQLKTLADRDPDVAYSGPLVVLVNKFSASASEILAGALQDYGRAIIAGSEHTHGKGTVQAVVDLDRSFSFPSLEKYKPLGALKVTIQKFYRISGESTQYRGVVPDIVLPDKLRALKTGEQYIDYSLPWDTVAPTVYEFWGNPVNTLHLKELKEKSTKRVMVDEDFISIAKESEATQEKIENTLQSLNIDKVRKELEEEKLFDLKPGEAMTSDDEGEKTAQLDEEEKKKRWIEKVNHDPYVEEAAYLLEDLIASHDAVSVGSPVAGHQLRTQ